MRRAEPRVIGQERLYPQKDHRPLPIRPAPLRRRLQRKGDAAMPAQTGIKDLAYLHRITPTPSALTTCHALRESVGRNSYTSDDKTLGSPPSTRREAAPRPATSAPVPLPVPDGLQP